MLEALFSLQLKPSEVRLDFTFKLDFTHQFIYKNMQNKWEVSPLLTGILQPHECSLHLRWAMVRF